MVDDGNGLTLLCFSCVFFCLVVGTDVGVLTLVEGSFAPFGELNLPQCNLYDMSHIVT